MRFAASPFLLLVLFAATSTIAWSAKGSTIRVEAMVGEAVVVFEDIDCPDTAVAVPTGEVAQTNPATCETVVALATVSDRVNDVVWAIAAADLDDPAELAAVEAQLANLSTAEQAMVVAVLTNNPKHLGTNEGTVVAAVTAIVSVNPQAAATVVLTAAVLAPSNAEAVTAAAVAAAPEQAENIQEASESAREINQEFKDNQQAQSPEDSAGDDVEEGGEEDPEVEVISVEESESEAEPVPEPPPAPVDSDVPPGGAIDEEDIPGPPSPE